MNTVSLSTCCATVNILESVFLSFRRPDGKMGRRVIATVVMCMKCWKVTGDYKTVGKPRLPREDFEVLLGVKKMPPFYVEEQGGHFVPEGLDLVAYERAKNVNPSRRISVAPQERAANDHVDEELHFEG